ncbi:MAG: hypothetical protein GC178_09670 [Flavobacteriales bacterium]|nr:hypothetical protein [Flavobacteriales bacterium]
MITVITRFFNLAIIFIFTAIFAGKVWAQEDVDTIYTEIRSYGTSCFTVQRGDVALLTDPFISNPSATQVMFGRVQTDQDYVDLYVNTGTFRKVKMVIAGHSHYDHLMDLPFLSKYLPKETPVVLNETGKHILSWYNLPQPLIVANDSLGSAEKEGKWIYDADSTLRVMALQSQHPPHFAGINLMNKRYTEDVRTEPVMMKDWQEGKTMAFLVDWLEGDSITYRIYFSGSLAKAPFGMFPKKLLDEHPVDDLFISAALFDDFEKAPKPIIDLCKPKRVILMHWENFFRSKEKEVKALNEKELEELITRLQKEYGNRITIIKPEPLNYY